jgi:regulator of protease activity HflC (stomatin/prohibitin superfamily)
MAIKLRIRKHEVGLWFRHRDFKRPLAPGAYWLPGRLLFGRDRVEIVNTLETKLEHPLLYVIVDDERLRELLTVVNLTANQRAFVWTDGRLGWILGPGRHAFWNRPYKIEVEIRDISEFMLDHPKREAIFSFPGGVAHFDVVRVPTHERAMLFRDGELVGPLDAGLHIFWKDAGKITCKSVDLREQVADVAGQEIMTADKVTLRVNLVVTYQVTDPMAAVTVVADHTQALYRDAQLALREAVGARSLDKLLTDKDAVGREVADAIAARSASFGVAVRGVGLRDIILPGDMKSILNQVIEAQKQAEANLVRRREETAAARSQANTARLLADNPALARMKELEALTDMLRGTKATFVLGSGQISEQIGRLVSDGETTGA